MRMLAFVIFDPITFHFNNYVTVNVFYIDISTGYRLPTKFKLKWTGYRQTTPRLH